MIRSGHQEIVLRLQIPGICRRRRPAPAQLILLNHVRINVHVGTVITPQKKRSKLGDNLSDGAGLVAVSQTSRSRLSGVQPVADDEGVGALAFAQPVGWERATDADDGLEHQTHVVVEVVGLVEPGLVEAVRLEGEEPGFQDHLGAVRGLEADLDAHGIVENLVAARRRTERLFRLVGNVGDVLERFFGG